MRIPGGANAGELDDFAKALAELDGHGFQAEGRIHVDGAGYMTVEYDSINYCNIVTSLEVDE